MEHLRRRLVIFVIVFILLSIIAASYFVFFFKGKESCDNLCTRGNCQKTTKILVENLDAEVKPCQDFYSHACGNFIKRIENNTRFGRLTKMDDGVELSMKEIFTELDSNISTIEGKIKAVYDSCIDYSSSEMNAIPSVLKFFKLIGMEDWPNLPKDFRFVNPSLEEAIGIMIGYNEFPFLKFERDSTRSSDGLRKFKVIGKIYQTVTNAEKFLQQIVNHFKPYQSAHNIVQDYLSISNEASSILYQFQEDKYPTMDVNCSSSTRQWKFICDVARYVRKHNDMDEDFTLDSLVVNNAPVLLLTGIQNFYNHTALANFFAIGFLRVHALALDSFIFDSMMDYLRSEFNQKYLHIEKWSACIFWMSKNLPQTLAKLYFSKKLPLHKLKDVNIIFEEFKEAADESINESTWMSEGFKTKLRTELLTLKVSPLLWSKYVMDSAFDSIIGDYFPSHSSFLWNVLDYRKEEFWHKSLTLFPEEAQNFDRIFDTSASITSDLVVLPFGSLLPPMYDYDRPRWMNVAALGFVIGHEIGHSLNRVFTTPATPEESFKKLRAFAHCVGYQLSNFTYLSGQKADGVRTYDESMADFIGIQLVERVINKMKDGIQPICVPELPYSTKQLVYFLLTQIFCETDAEEENIEDVHAENRHRMTLIMQNSEEFSAAYQCPESSYMNIQNKCTFF